MTYNFRVDTKAPVVERASLSNGGSTLNVEISDESPLAGFTVNDPNSGQYIYRDVIRNDADQTYSNGRYHYTATVDMSRVSGGSSSKPYVLAWDYGLNHSKATTIGAATGNGGDNGGNTGDQPGNGGGDNGGNTGDQPGNGGGNDGGNTGDQPGNGGGDNGGGIGGNVCSPSMGGRWVTDGYRWAWQCNNGAYLRNGWYLIDGRYYYFDGNGYMRSGWVRGRGSWYYLGNNGAMQTGWVKIGGRWYYLGSDGAMYSGTRTIDGNSYEFSESGEWVK